MRSLYHQRVGLRATTDLKLTKRLLNDCEIPYRYHQVSLSLIPPSQHRNALFSYVTLMHEIEREGIGVFIHGEVGTGKTSATIGVAKHALARGGACMFVEHSFLRREMRSFRPRVRHTGETYVDAARNVHFLVLDDFCSTPEWAGESETEELIRARYNWQLPTLLSTNRTPEELADLSPVMNSLLNEKKTPVGGSPYRRIHIDGPSWRDNPPC